MAFYALYVVLGLFAGLMGGMLGIGGGVIIVPVLITLFALQGFEAQYIPIVAVATSLASIIVTSFSAMRAQKKRGAVDWVLFRQWAVLVVLGGFCSGFIAELIPAIALKRGIAVFLVIVASIMLSQWMPKPERQLPGKVGTGILGVFAGMLSALAGIGGGNVIVPTLVFFNVQMQRAAATASALGLPIATVGTISYVVSGWSQTIPNMQTIGFVFWPAALLIACGAFVAAPLGVSIAHKLPAKTLKRVFGGLLMIVALRMLWQSI